MKKSEIQRIFFKKYNCNFLYNAYILIDKEYKYFNIEEYKIQFNFNSGSIKNIEFLTNEIILDSFELEKNCKFKYKSLYLNGYISIIENRFNGQFIKIIRIF